MDYKYLVSISSFEFYRAQFLKARAYLPDDEKGTRIMTNFQGGWGDINPVEIVTDAKQPLPIRLELTWVTVLDDMLYELDTKLDAAKAEELWEKQEEDQPEDPFTHIVVGVAPYGGVAVWLKSENKQVLLQWLEAEEKEPETDLEKILCSRESDKSMIESVMSKKLMEQYMHQYYYRFVPLEEFFDGNEWVPYDEDDDYYDDIDVDGIEVNRTDGTYQHLPDNKLLRLHHAGIPNRISLRWSVDREHFFSHYWLDTELMATLFDHCEMMDPEGHIDLMLRVDSRSGQYELAFRHDQMQKCKTIPPFAYQLIVFKDGHELYKSPNFAQEDGAWNW